MVEILLDTKFWNKIYKLLKPATVVAVKKIKGNSKGKLIPSDYSLSLKQYTNNEVGFLLRCMLNNIGSSFPSYFTEKGKLSQVKKKALEEGITSDEIKEIEKAIIRVAIQEGIMPETTLYEEEHVVVVQSQQNTISNTHLTDSFGFVYFIRNQDIYKIGITDNLLRRIGELKPDEIINVVRCINYKELEKKLHSKFKSNRIPQTEYFRLDQGEVSLVNELMTESAQFRE